MAERNFENQFETKKEKNTVPKVLPQLSTHFFHPFSIHFHKAFQCQNLL